MAVLPKGGWSGAAAHGPHPGGDLLGPEDIRAQQMVTAGRRPGSGYSAGSSEVSTSTVVGARVANVA
ncbi:hypothetical protein [Zhihengliuella flava]|uniref:Uncharacterized protein n=1 Tax=Zhihengliuella flava TaxID=1285193 RepID=A0A931D9Q8_9MICC|nr:hypothetical protein [Zhihengliuella flava]MBG6085027.1 hypothetical protein [Zhihengliuella flava]